MGCFVYEPLFKRYSKDLLMALLNLSVSVYFLYPDLKRWCLQEGRNVFKETLRWLPSRIACHNHKFNRKNFVIFLIRNAWLTLITLGRLFWWCCQVFDLENDFCFFLPLKRANFDKRHNKECFSVIAVPIPIPFIFEA